MTSSPSRLSPSSPPSAAPASSNGNTPPSVSTIVAYKRRNPTAGVPAVLGRFLLDPQVYAGLVAAMLAHVESEGVGENESVDASDSPSDADAAEVPA